VIDLHSHLLPGIDDGPAHLDDALAMAQMAVADGIHTSVLTPHIHPGRYENERAGIEAAVQRFGDALQAAGIALRVLPGAEVRISPESLALVLQGRVPRIGIHQGSPVVLVELPHSGIPVGSLQFVQKLLSQNIRPVLAHPERNKAIMDDPERAAPFVRAGCWLQITAGAVTGHFGAQAQAAAAHFIGQGDARWVASDAHNTSSRPPQLRAARERVSAQWGEATAQRLFHTHPEQILGAAP
jgi:protein-tyrosine phosphatase